MTIEERIMLYAAQAAEFDDANDFAEFRQRAVSETPAKKGLLTTPTEGKLPLKLATAAILNFVFFSKISGAMDTLTALRRTERGLADFGVFVPKERASFDEVENKARLPTGYDGWEISAHIASAPDHAPYQGRQYTAAEFQKIQASLPRPFMAWNCRHFITPVVLGETKPTFSAGQLRQMNEENRRGVIIDGEHYTAYEAVQRRRVLQKRVDRADRRLDVAKASKVSELIAEEHGKLVFAKREYTNFAQYVSSNW